MEQLTKEQICDKIAKLRSELATYQGMLDKIELQEESEFSRKVKAMVGRYYMRDFTDYKWYCRIDCVNSIEDSNIDGLYATCECALVLTPKYTNDGYKASTGGIYIDECELEEYKPITEGEFDAVLTRFTNALRKTTDK